MYYSALVFQTWLKIEYLVLSLVLFSIIHWIPHGKNSQSKMHRRIPQLGWKHGLLVTGSQDPWMGTRIARFGDCELFAETIHVIFVKTVFFYCPWMLRVYRVFCSEFQLLKSWAFRVEWQRPLHFLQAFRCPSLWLSTLDSLRTIRFFCTASFRVVQRVAMPHEQAKHEKLLPVSRQEPADLEGFLGRGTCVFFFWNHHLFQLLCLNRVKGTALWVCKL